MTEHLNYFALFYVVGILIFGLLMRIRYRHKRDERMRSADENRRVDEEMAKKILDDARSHRRARGIEEDS